MELNEIDQLECLIKTKRDEFGIVSTEPKTLIDLEKRILPIPTDGYCEPPRRRLASPGDLRCDMWSNLIKVRGKRYQACRIGSFSVEHESQKAAVESLLKFSSVMKEMIDQGSGVLLFGSKGTGKDHLAMGLAYSAVCVGKRVEWINGADMRGDVRDSTKLDELERDYVSKLLRPDVLWISDPLPIGGALTDAQQDRLFRVLDARYSQMKPTWVTVNVSSREELETRIGPQNADRLRDGALAVFCDWPSFREVLS